VSRSFFCKRAHGFIVLRFPHLKLCPQREIRSANKLDQCGWCSRMGPGRGIRQVVESICLHASCFHALGSKKSTLHRSWCKPEVAEPKEVIVDKQKTFSFLPQITAKKGG
jgi:hypothetical protein